MSGRTDCPVFLLFSACILNSLCRLLCFLFSPLRCSCPLEPPFFSLYELSQCDPTHRHLIPHSSLQCHLLPRNLYAHRMPLRPLKLRKHKAKLIIFLQSLTCFMAEAVAPPKDLIAIRSLHFHLLSPCVKLFLPHPTMVLRTNLNSSFGRHGPL